MRDHRQMVEGVIYRHRCGIAWRDLPSSFGPWQTVGKRHRRFSGDGTWDKILARQRALHDQLAHRHATNLPHVERLATPDADAGAEVVAAISDSAQGLS